MFIFQVYTTECSTVFNEECETEPVTTSEEVCHDVAEVTLTQQCSTRNLGLALAKKECIKQLNFSFDIADK